MWKSVKLHFSVNTNILDFLKVSSFCCDPILWKGDNLKTFKVEDYKNVLIIIFFFS